MGVYTFRTWPKIYAFYHEKLTLGQVGKCTLFVHLQRKKTCASVHFPTLCISEGGRCTLGVHLSGCTYIVFIHEVIICSLYKLLILEDSLELQYAFHIFPSKVMLSRTCHFCMNHSTITLFIVAMKEPEWAKSRFAAYQCNIIANFWSCCKYIYWQKDKIWRHIYERPNVVQNVVVRSLGSPY